MDMKNSYRIMIALMCMLTLLISGFALAEDAGETPASTPAPTPSPEELGGLTFLIEGPDESMPMTVKYSDFQDGKLILENLIPGTYTVKETDPDQLLTEYSFDADESIQQVTIEVKTNETGSGTLINVYERIAEDTPTPEPTMTPAPTKIPVDEKISIPVTKIWKDNNNQDGNRPERVIVTLLANGSNVGQAVLSEANGWSWQFDDLPKRSGEQEILYTVTEEPVPMYMASIDGFTITNVYTPETTYATVVKVWLDNDDEKGMRPDGIRCTLSNGRSVVLDASNSWSATIDDLPVIVNGQPAEYTWSEHEVIGYEQVSTDRIGNITIFTNTLIERGKNIPEGKSIPSKHRGDSYLIIEDYQTALGVEVLINHVGDCFD